MTWALAIFLTILAALFLSPLAHSWRNRRARSRQDRQHFERLKNAARREQ